jgi:hypothetical protein
MTSSLMKLDCFKNAYVIHLSNVLMSWVKVQDSNINCASIDFLKLHISRILHSSAEQPKSVKHSSRLLFAKNSLLTALSKPLVLQLVVLGITGEWVSICISH